jgi:transposase InsO family protein
LWLNDGSCVRLRPEWANHVWAYDFVEDRTRDGRKIRLLNVVDEFTRECLAIRVGRKLGSADVIDVLADLFIARGTPGYIRSDNGPEFVATAVKGWINGVGAKTAFIEPGSPWENGYVQYCSLCDLDGGCDIDPRCRLWRARAQWIAAHLALDPARHLPASGARHALLQDLGQDFLMQGESVLRGEKPQAAAACGAPRARHAGTTADPDPRQPAAPPRA